MAEPGLCSIIQRKLLVPDDFADLDILAERILAFEHRYNAAAAPFGWRFTRHDLSRLLQRIDARPAGVPALAA